MSTAGKTNGLYCGFSNDRTAYSLPLHVAPAMDVSLSKATNTKNHVLQFVQYFLIDDRFGVVDGEEKNARLAESLLAEPCLMVFWP